MLLTDNVKERKQSRPQISVEKQRAGAVLPSLQGSTCYRREDRGSRQWLCNTREGEKAA